ncbi:MAG: PAS domain S-box protein, partial [Gemmatimonadota bacterium]
MRPHRDQPTERRASALDNITRGRTWVPLAFVLLSLVALVIIPTTLEQSVTERRDHVTEVIEPLRALTGRIRVAHARQFEYIVGYHLTGRSRFRELYEASVERQRRSMARLRRLAAAGGPRIAGRVAILLDRLDRWHRTVESEDLLRSGVPSAELLARLSDRYAAFAATSSTAEAVDDAARERAAAVAAEIRAAESRRTRLSLMLAGMALFSAVLVAWLGVRLRRASLDLERRAYNEAELRSIAESLNTATEIEQVLRLAVTRVLEPTGAAGAYVERLSSDGREVEVVAAHGRGAPPAGTRVAYRGSVTRAALGAEDAISVRDIERFGPDMAPHLRTSCGDCVMLVAPLVSANEPLGALVALRPDDRARSFSRDEIFRAGGIGYLTGVALRRTIAMDEAESERRERTLLLESTTEGVCGLDRDGRLKFLNASAVELLELAHASLTDPTLHGIVHPHHADEDAVIAGECPLLDAIRTGRRIRNGEDVFRTTSGRRLPVLYSLSPVVEDGEVTGAVVVFTDITERRRAAEERERLLEREREARSEAERRRHELERLMESRARFVRGFSHDLKNPLGAARGHARLLADGMLGSLADEQPRSVRSIEGSIDTALR